jgi:hypothetical protein
MSGTDARERARAAGPPQASSERTGPVLPAGTPSGRRRGRRRWVTGAAAGLVAVLAAGAGAVWLAGGFRARGAPGSGSGNAASGYGTSTAVVSRQTLTSQTSVSATLGYAGSYQVSGKAIGTITWLPSAGRVIRDGRVLYRVGNGTPVLLLSGRVPAWRTLNEGSTGQDVTQLNHDLVKLRYADSGDIAALGWSYFSWETKYGLQQLQDAAGLSSPSGILALGSAVFEPAAIRVTSLIARLGGSGAGPILSATADQHVVTIRLDADEQSEVKRGDAVSVTLPDGTSTPGVVSSMGRVASGAGGSAKITVQVRLRHPRAAGRLDQAPVTVYITTGRVRHVLVVPVAALLARASDGYAVEVVSGGRHHLVNVSPGLFDDRSGKVQVSGNLEAGQRVVVPAT